MNETPHEPRRPADGGHDRPSRPDTDLDDDVDDDVYDGGEADEPSRRRRFLSGGRLAAVGAVVVLAGTGLALAFAGGGGGGDSSGAGASSSGEPTSSLDAVVQFAECMRENGIEDFPDPVPGEGGYRFGGPGGLPDPGELPPRERAEFDDASDACQPIRGEEGPEPLSAEEVAERQDDALAMARCMRNRGWDMPDPEVTEEGNIGIEDGALPEPEDPDFDQFAQDQQECGEEAGLPAPGDSGGGS